MTAAARPFPLPEDVGLKRARASTYLFRAAASHVRSHITNNSPQRCAKEMFGDPVTELVLRAASAPATTTTSTWASQLATQSVDDSIAAITSVSAAAALIQRGTKLDFAGAASIKVPGHLVDSSDAGGWVGEGQPVKVRAQRITAGPTLAPRKAVVVTTFTNEMARSSNIEAVSRALISEATALLLDTTMFGTQADNGVTPGGLLNGVTGLTPTTGGGANALVGDIKNLIAALVAAGAGRDPVIVTNPVQAATLQLLAGAKFDMPVLQSTSIAVSTIIMVEASSFVSAFGPTPEFLTGQEMTIHMEADTPADIVAGGTAAAPAKSMFQVDSVALRMTLRAAWGLRGATVAGKANIAYITGATW